MDAPIDPSPPATLDYAPLPPWHRRRAARCFILFLALGFIAGFSFKLLPAIIFRARILYWQRQCLKHIGNSNTEVSKAGIPNEWQQFHKLMSGGPRAVSGLRLYGVATAFLHELGTPMGENRLVAVDRFIDQHGNVALCTSVFVPGDFVRSPNEIILTQYSPLIPADAVIFEGKADTTDLSHFTIAYRPKGSGTITLDGWLFDNGAVLIEPRGEITPPPPPSSAQSR